MVLLYKNYHIHSSLYARSWSRLGKSSQKFGVELHVMVFFGSLKAIDAGEMDGRSANLAVECRHVFLPFCPAGDSFHLCIIQLFHCLFSFQSRLSCSSPLSSKVSATGAFGTMRARYRDGSFRFASSSSMIPVSSFRPRRLATTMRRGFPPTRSTSR